jgi:hypothetical protein
VHQRTPTTKLLTFGNFQRPLRYNSPDCPVYTGHVRCSQEKRPPELASLGFSLQPLRYNSPDCPVYTGLSGATEGQRLFRRQRLPARIKCARRGQTRPYWRTRQSTVYVRCATGHPGGPRRQSSNGRPQRLLVTWLSHRTCPVCTGLSGAPSNRQLHQTASLVVGAINTPNHPTFKSSKFSTSQLLTRALAFNSRHTKEIKSSPNSTQRLSD